jgi:hypothetical protein
MKTTNLNDELQLLRDHSIHLKRATTDGDFALAQRHQSSVIESCRRIDVMTAHFESLSESTKTAIKDTLTDALLLVESATKDVQSKKDDVATLLSSSSARRRLDTAYRSTDL